MLARAAARVGKARNCAGNAARPHPKRALLVGRDARPLGTTSTLLHATLRSPHRPANSQGSVGGKRRAGAHAQRPRANPD